MRCNGNQEWIMRTEKEIKSRYKYYSETKMSYSNLKRKYFKEILINRKQGCQQLFWVSHSDMKITKNQTFIENK